MSVQALSRAWGRRGLSAEAKLILLLLADIADDRDRCEPDIAWLADVSENSPARVRTLLDQLEQRGLIQPDGLIGYRLALEEDPEAMPT